MRTVLPGKPQAKLQAICSAEWNGKRLVTYISGNALIILGGYHDLIQTIYHDQCSALDAVVIDESSGNIATCGLDEVYIYKPYGEKEGVLKWTLQATLCIPTSDRGNATLSWGSEVELLVGSSSLKLHHVTEGGRVIWDQNLPKPVQVAKCSYDASYIASTGWHDRLVKLWRRQSFDSDDTRFDFTYLPHPTAVTTVHWRKPNHKQYTIDHVLFSICADSKIRIWAATDPHGLQVLQLWAEIDMLESIQPRQVDSSPLSKERFAFMIDSSDFVRASEVAIQYMSSNDRPISHAQEHLLEILKLNPEVFVILDRQGNMSAWGLENVGCKERKPTDVFNIAHIDDFGPIFSQNGNLDKDHMKMLNFCCPQEDSSLALLVHCFDGRVTWFECSLEELLDPSPRQQRLHAKALWTGHDGAIKKIVRSLSGKALISRTDDNEGLVWKQKSNNDTMRLARSSSFSCSEHIHRTCVLDEGNFIINLHHHSMSLWDARGSVAHQVCDCKYEVEGKVLCLVPLPSPDRKPHVFYLATITSSMKGSAWIVHVPGTSDTLESNEERSQSTSIRQFCTFDLGRQEELTFVLPVDPAGSLPTASNGLDPFAKDIAISYTNSGTLLAWTAAIEMTTSTVNWLSTSTVETSIKFPSLASGNSIRKTAVVDASKTRLTVWDSWSAQLEFDATYGFQDTIQDLDWSSTPDNQSILAVGFPHKILVLAQMRYDYLNRGAAWAPIREITTKELTGHPIGDSTWLGSGNLVVGAGNQLYVYDEAVSTSDDMVIDLSLPIHDQRSLNIFDLVTYLNGPLPVFHPQFLGQLLLAGKLVLAQRIILELHKTLNFYVPGDSLDSFVALSVCEFFDDREINAYAAQKEMRSSYADFVDDEEPQTVTEELAARINENLATLAIPQLSSHEQIQLADLIECVATAEKHRRSMDDNATRYLLFFRQHMLRRGQAPDSRVSITWREIVWAYHSGSQDILVDLVARQFHGKMLWNHARESGICMWMTDLTALRAQFEVIARNEYTKTDEKNPIDCSLYYLALKKKTVLLGLWRMASWNREQAGTQRLLKNDFSEPRWRTAALKNAYALLGKRRFEYAASWFLLAGNLQDAVNVCAHQLQDLQLAVAIARVYDGDGSPILHSLLEDKVLPQAALDGNRWLATWAFWMLGRRDMAVRVLISPVSTLIDLPTSPAIQTKSYLSSDPALVILYKQLREKSLQTLKGASQITPRLEWEFVIQNARLYDRMGCDLLALDLVRNWDFLQQPKEPTTNGNTITDPRKMLRRRSSLVVDDLPSPKSPTAFKVKQSGKPAPTVFEEPTSNSLLDNFGF